MNTRPPIENPSEHAALSVAFNNDASRFTVGLDSGFCIFMSDTCQIQTARVFNAGLAVVQMMGNANYLALVGGGRSPKFPQNKVIIWDDSKGKIAFEIATLTSVRGVQISKTRVAVVLQDMVRVYAFDKPPRPLARYETADNMLGLCCLTDEYLVFPGRTPGQVQVVHLATDSVSIIPAHSSSLRALQLSLDGELLATASEKGTIIRIFSTRNGAKLAERRRGTENATIYSLRFSPSGNMLSCTSDKGNLHIFDVPNPRRSPSPPHPPEAAKNPGDKTNAEASNKWGILKNIPFGPFSDVYSFTSAPFETGDEPLLPTAVRSTGTSPVLGTSRPMKGVVGWINNHSLLVVGAGQDARWEKFVLRQGEDGRSVVVREGWKRYLGN
ncbi:Uu.00g115120.m01.CDS01 [Anthostomella pinea]|uniref:Uu.00g115120.m01.CDS01 n=1 Tax=Anthostomella pinea TaxID=933095 RepID=A0AAI8VFP0_9PEZI|nr:Uu.00g115120.m01.CDS01 [Anthostomella pinea]